MSCGVAVACVERGNKSGCEREVRPLETIICFAEFGYGLSLLPIHDMQSLRRKCRNEEERGAPRSKSDVAVRQHANERGVERYTCERDRTCRPSKVPNRTCPAQNQRRSTENEVQPDIDNRSSTGSGENAAECIAAVVHYLKRS